MIKSLKADIIQYSVLAVLIFIICISTLLRLFFISLPSLILCLSAGLYYEIQNRRHLYLENRDEINDLKNQLNNENIKDIIKDLFFSKGKNLTKITNILESQFDIELLIPKGIDRGNYKSRELVDELCYILGFKNKKECIDAYHEFKKKKNYSGQ
ncbi:MAG: hypothetical protein ACFE9S_20565 [Candidatus Hermodarchaeota archaeon]